MPALFNKRVLNPEEDYLERGDMVGRANKAFAKLIPDYKAKKDRIGDELQPLTDCIARREKAGENVSVADQMAREIGWLAKYTAFFERAEARLGQLKELLKGPLSPPPEQDDVGSWGPGCTEPYRKLESTVDALQITDPRTDGLKPLIFMAQYQDPKTLLADFYRLQITDIEQFRQNFRDELGSLQSSFSQLIFKDGLRESLNEADLGFKVTPELMEAYSDYLEQTQHPRTGYWGPWYRFDGQLIRVQDLSFTFHTISYRGGDVARWPLIIDTTLDIEDVEYPGGWYANKNKGIKYTNHNNFDVITIFAYGWPHIDSQRKASVQAAIVKLLKWCLTEAIERDGGFKPEGGLLANSYYFGVRFLDKAGYWDPMKRFWGRDLPKLPDDLPTPGALAKRLKAMFEKFNDKSPEAGNTRLILRMAAASEE